VVDEIVRAVVAAVEQNRLKHERLAEAASRLDALAAWRSNRSPPTHVSRAIGLAAARRAVCADGPVGVGDQAVVIRFAPPPSIAAGDVPWGMAASLAARGVHVVEGAEDVPGKSLVLVVRDLDRHPAHRAAVETLIERRPDAIVVEMGLPAYRPRGAKAYVATHGSARVCADAAAEVMRP
jgi:beta-N-acetylhexosaminidase